MQFSKTKQNSCVSNKSPTALLDILLRTFQMLTNVSKVSINVTKMLYATTQLDLIHVLVKLDTSEMALNVQVGSSKHRPTCDSAVCESGCIGGFCIF